MLLSLLRAAHSAEVRREQGVKTAALLARLPDEDLHRLATTGKLAHESTTPSDSTGWVTQFAGTPLEGSAMELAEKELALETQIAQQYAMGEDAYREKDQLNIQKRLLELELVRSQSAAAAAAAAEPPAEPPADPAAAGTAPPPAAAVPPPPPPDAPPGGAPAVPPEGGAPKMAGRKTAMVGQAVSGLLGDLKPKFVEAAKGLVASHPREVAGAALGGVAGLAHGAAADKDGNHSIGRSLAEGVGGAALGAGAGHLSTRAPEIAERFKAVADRFRAPPAGSAGG